MYVGPIAYNLNLLGDDQRGAVTKASIIKSIAVEGPCWGYKIREKATELAEQAGQTVPIKVSSFYKQINDLVERGYLKEKEIVDVPHVAGPDRHLYDLTVKGSIVAMQMQYVRDHVVEFVKHKDPSDKSHLFRLPGLTVFRVWNEHGVAKGITDFVLEKAVKGVFNVGGFVDVTNEEELIDTWSLQLTQGFFALRKLTPKDLKGMGLSKDEGAKAIQVLREDPEGQEYVKEFRDTAVRAFDNKLEVLNTFKDYLKAITELNDNRQSASR